MRRGGATIAAVCLATNGNELARETVARRVADSGSSGEETLSVCVVCVSLAS